MKDLYPLFLQPVYKDYIWGGDQIIKQFHRKAPPGVYAESWEVSDRADGMSTVVNGPLKGKSLRNLMQEYRNNLLGLDAHFDQFPLLIKLIDAHNNLSVQVHPNDETASSYGGEAKTEAWHILKTEVGAVIYAGFRKNFLQEEIEKKLSTRDIITMMRALPAKQGDTIFIPGGRLHAIGSGCLLFEIQQNSNTTYRVYDWDRTEKNGKPRPLHLKEASRVILWNDTQYPIVEPTQIYKSKTHTITKLIDSPYFHMERWEIHDGDSYTKLKNKCEILFLLSGEATLHYREMEGSWQKGMSCLIPASVEEIKLKVNKNPCCFLKVYL